jgi:hypothetical protein
MLFEEQLWNSVMWYHVSGRIGTKTLQNCNPETPTPVLTVKKTLKSHRLFAYSLTQEKGISLKIWKYLKKTEDKIRLQCSDLSSQ